MKNLRIALRKIQPYFVEYNLIPKLYFKEDKDKIDYWVFFYHFIRKLNYRAIGARLGFDHSTIAYKMTNILKNNQKLIEDFIFQQSLNEH